MYYGYGYEPNIQITVNLLPIPKSNVSPLKSFKSKFNTIFNISAIPKERKFKILLCKNQPELQTYGRFF